MSTTSLDIPDVFRAIADPTRRHLLDRLGEGEHTVSELLVPLPMSQPALSKHLRILREAGLVGVRKEGRQRRYRLEAARLQEVARWLSHYERFWTDRLDRLGDYLDAKKERER